MNRPAKTPAQNQDPAPDTSDDLDKALWDGRGIVHTPDGPVTGEDDWA